MTSPIPEVRSATHDSTGTNKTIRTVGFLGAGLMGRGMARSLIRGGHRVRIYNRTREKAEEAAQLGAEVASTPAEAVRGADIIVTMLADPAAVLSTIEGEHGVLSAVQAGAVLIDSSTVSPPTTLRVLAALKSRGADMLDAPVFGSKGEAEKGALGFIVGGERDVVARVQDVLDCMGRTIYVGSNGMGAYAKLVVNLIIASTLQAYSEGMVLATKAGIPPEAMTEIILSSRARSGIIEMKAPQILKRDFSPFFPLQLMAKDIRLVVESAESLNVQLPFAQALNHILAACSADGLAGEDFAAIIKSLEKRAGVEVKGATTAT
jgi:3-hydroxyisobutyrate dehydrogenase-like beta-hydroxyacid dehydrogenase